MKSLPKRFCFVTALLDCVFPEMKGPGEVSSGERALPSEESGGTTLPNNDEDLAPGGVWFQVPILAPTGRDAGKDSPTPPACLYKRNRRGSRPGQRSL